MVIMRERYLGAAVAEIAWAANKMAFVSGPRQCGKTTLAKLKLAERATGRYANWDDVEVRRTWVRAPKELVRFTNAPDGTPLLALDEIHKAKGWKRTLKGIYDTLENPCDILVTGSARLAVYKKGGDSLVGRYFDFRLHPFSLGELESGKPSSPEDFLEGVFEGGAPRPEDSLQKTLEGLLRYGGFPEPFLRQSARFARLWQLGRTEKVVREDLRDLSRIPELSRVEMLVALLPDKAAQPLSVQSLREDLEVAHDTVRRWLNYLAELYYLYEIKPYSKSIPRSLKREGKLYLWDWSEVPEPGPRFENLVAGHLLKAAHYWTDTGEGLFQLHYLRNKQKQEVDFLLTRDRLPWLAVECKLADTALHPGFQAFVPRIQCGRFVQLVAAPAVRKPVTVGASRGLIVSAAPFLAHCP